MAYEFQVAVDCADAHTLADWWAETLGWQVEPSDEAFIRRMISAGYATEDATKLHNGVLVWKDGAAMTRCSSWTPCSTSTPVRSPRSWPPTTPPTATWSSACSRF